MFLRDIDTFSVSTGADIDALYRQGNALRLAGRSVDAEASLREVLRRDPTHRDAAWSLAHMLREDGRTVAAAVVVCALWKNIQPGIDDALAILGFLNESGEPAHAIHVARDARHRWPSDARLAARAGEIALALGRFDEAAIDLRSALDRDPLQSAAWLRLAYCRRFTDIEDVDVKRFAQGCTDPNLDANSRTCAGFAFGKALDDLGNYEHAEQTLRAANSQAKDATNWQHEEWQNFIDARLRTTLLPDSQLSKTRANRSDENLDFVPVFIIGLPRTGTTLVANALGKLAQVRDRGELNWIPMLYSHAVEHGQLHNLQALQAIARMIRAQMRRDDAPARFYIDKNPLNFRYVDFILALFPNAKFVYTRRSARDTALSLWMQHFAHLDLGFAYNFSTIAQVEKDCRRLMAHWREKLNPDLIEVNYERFVNHPALERQRLAQFLGAADSSDSVDAKPDEAVTTASVWQVRQPVYTHSVERWRRYAPYLPELTSLFAEE